jgi:hypothetical protein
VEPVAAPAEPIGPSQHRHRFGFLTGALIGVLVAAVALAVVVIVGSRDTSKDGLAPNWSSWRPPDTDAATGSAEIARHVETAYRLDDGTQLVKILITPAPDIQVLVRPVGGNIQQLSGHAVVYTLDGLGPQGSIISGKPSARRGALVRREALELALYSFRYLNGVDMVVALLPPARASKTKPAGSPLAVFYRPGDLLPQLKVPLRVTLSRKTLKPSTLPRTEMARVLSLTNANVFKWKVTRAQDGTPYLVLARPD